MRADQTAQSLTRSPARTVAFGAGLVLTGLLAWGLTAESDPGVDAKLADGQAPLAPAFDLPLLQLGSLPPKHGELASKLSDERLTLDELEGTPFVLNIWASWCDPCREEAPALERQWQESGPRGVLFLGLNIQDLPEDASRFLREFEISYPNVREEGNGIARAYGSTGLPETYFVSERGRIVGHVLGVVSPERLVEGAEAARTGRVLGTEAGGASRDQH